MVVIVTLYGSNCHCMSNYGSNCHSIYGSNCHIMVVLVIQG